LVHAQAPFEHTQVLQPSSAILVVPLVHTGVGHARSVHAHVPLEHVQVLQPSSAIFVSPGAQTAPASVHPPPVWHPGSSPLLPVTSVLPEHASMLTGTHISHQIREAITVSKARCVPGWGSQGMSCRRLRHNRGTRSGNSRHAGASARRRRVLALTRKYAFLLHAIVTAMGDATVEELVVAFTRCSGPRTSWFALRTRAVRHGDYARGGNDNVCATPASSTRFRRSPRA
jgi:hypothetical protein